NLRLSHKICLNERTMTGNEGNPIMKKFMMIMMALGLVVVLAACNDDSEDNNENGSKESQDEQASGQQEMPEPDLEGIPDVVAEVNGEEITGDEFESTYQGQF